MDIREWLQNTADREPPDEHDHSRFTRPKRKRASSDPPARAQGKARLKRHQTASHSSSSDHVRLAGEDTDSSRSTNNSTHSRNTSVSARDRLPVKSYERRARHKTRPDRYDPKIKKPRKDREKKDKSKRRKSHRSGDGARTAGLIQSFQLNHGLKNERLTLRPGANGGIFKHGRASAPMAANGAGLPDLVFNEMKFLQRPREHQDELPRGEAKKPTKKSRKDIRDEEISAYFKRPGVAGQGGKGAPHNVSTKGSATDRPQDRATHVADAAPPAEASFLGFGSRGLPPGPSAAHATSKTCYTWSESIPPQQKAAQGQIGPHSKQYEDKSDVRDQRQVLPHALHSQASQSQQRARLKHIHGRQQRRSSAFESSQPLPVADSAAPRRRYTDSGSHPASERYHTSDILKLRQPRSMDGRSSSSQIYQSRAQVVAGKENDDPRPATSSSGMLRSALKAINKSYGNAKLDFRPESELDTLDGIGRRNAAELPDEPPNVRLAPGAVGTKGQDQPVIQSTHLPVPHRGFSLAETKSLPQRQRRALGPISTNTSRPQPTASWQPSPATTGQTSTRTLGRLNVQDDMLDLLTADQFHVLNNREIHAKAYYAEDLVRGLAFEQAPELYDTVREEPVSHVDNAVYEEGIKEEAVPRMRWNDDFATVPETFAYGDDGGTVEDEASNDFTAFWRPNRLY
ncbi:hypothetical protein AC578_10333 [Pseudocercospora eumusae]|uniref:Uncharacterized protein n=1 Tax=Pseudocercospora eumusae TaxID=321146 RepID=A0A139HRB2_9PEZI|nr:hypothetical protein AC578_10333 [Pseudocercospora eumusae]KXT04977.1 hypothetical protein AC578_10333 [Pseudocercospora eumusae]